MSTFDDVPSYTYSSLVQDKYIGLFLALTGNAAIGCSFIITKKGLISAGGGKDARNQREGPIKSTEYLQNPIWWAGMITMVVGELANFAAYAFAPPVLVTPLGAVSVLIGAVLASVFLKEELGRIGRVGCALCLLGSLVIVLHAPEDKEIQTVDEILGYCTRPGFLFYVLFVTVFCLYMIYRVAPVHGTSNPLVYLSICSLAGSVSIMAIKGLGVALKLTFSGNNQLTHLPTYIFALVVGGCIATQMNYFNKALDTFSTNVVNPIYYVTFSTATIVASLLLFQGLNTTGGVNTISLICGFLTTFLGVYLLNLSRSIPSSSDMNDSNDGVHQSHRRRISHSYLETGVLNPRISISDDARPLQNGGGRLGARGGYDDSIGHDDEDGFPLRRHDTRHSSQQKRNSIQSYNHQGQFSNVASPTGDRNGAYSKINTDVDRTASFPPPGSAGGGRRSQSQRQNDLVFDIGNEDDDALDGYRSR